MADSAQLFRSSSSSPFSPSLPVVNKSASSSTQQQRLQQQQQQRWSRVRMRLKSKSTSLRISVNSIHSHSHSHSYRYCHSDSYSSSPLLECFSAGCKPFYDETLEQDRDEEGDEDKEEEEEEEESKEAIAFYNNNNKVTVKKKKMKKRGESFGVLLSRCGSIGEECYTAAMAEDCRNPNLVVEYAWFLSSIPGEKERALRFFEEAVHMSPNDTNILASFTLFLWQTQQ